MNVLKYVTYHSFESLTVEHLLPLSHHNTALSPTPRQLSLDLVPTWKTWLQNHTGAIGGLRATENTNRELSFLKIAISYTVNP